MAKNQQNVELSVIVPCFNEEGKIDEMVRRMRRALDGKISEWELIFVDDGSSDNTKISILHVEKIYPQVKGCFHERCRKG